MMRSCRIVFFLAILSGAVLIQLPTVSARPPVTTADLEVAFGRKNITVFARNAATALAKAQADNPDWVVISVTKVNKDPKSMAYRVVLKKK